MNGLHLFIDNSNLYIEGQRVAREKFRYDDQLIVRLRISYGNLILKICNERKLMETVLVGSRPPTNDSLWRLLKKMNITPRIFDRSLYSNKEKGVDAELTNAIRDTLEDNSEQGTIALVAGDKDYIPTIERCIKKKWNVEIYFWEQASASLKSLPKTSSNITFISLDTFFNEIIFHAKERE